ncbi:MAG: glycosyltransferase family 2 protein [Acidimicrobiia bacterium]|nr:glycosyltransferase family 2 protein [Acidimicrobiia bacterium]
MVADQTSRQGSVGFREQICLEAGGELANRGGWLFSTGDVEVQLCVSVVIPALNEEGSIADVIRGLPDDVMEILVVDGHSTDRTVELATLASPKVKILTQQGQGKGDALRHGFLAASGDITVMLDADGSMRPEEIHLMVAALAQGFDVVKGSRFVLGGGSHDLSVLRRLGNRGLLAITNTLFHSRYTDLCYGYIAFRRSALDALLPEGDGFEVETEILVRAYKAGLRIGEVPSFELERSHGVSKLHPVRDGVRVLRTILVSRSAQRGRVAEAACP